MKISTRTIFAIVLTFPLYVCNESTKKSIEATAIPDAGKQEIRIGNIYYPRRDKVFLEGHGIRSYENIGEFGSLKMLMLTDSNITDYSELAKLKNLKSLAIRSQPIPKPAQLAKINGLKTLVLTNTKIPNLNFLKDLEDLRELALVCNGINGLEVQHMHKLIYLEIINEPLKAFPKLPSNLKELRLNEKLYLRFKKVVDKYKKSNPEVELVITGSRCI